MNLIVLSLLITIFGGQATTLVKTLNDAGVKSKNTIETTLTSVIKVNCMTYLLSEPNHSCGETTCTMVDFYTRSSFNASSEVAVTLMKMFTDLKLTTSISIPEVRVIEVESINCVSGWDQGRGGLVNECEITQPRQ